MQHLGIHHNWQLDSQQASCHCAQAARIANFSRLPQDVAAALAFVHVAEQARLRVRCAVSRTAMNSETSNMQCERAGVVHTTNRFSASSGTTIAESIERLFARKCAGAARVSSPANAIPETISLLRGSEIR
jgi:hypothetical protein